MRSNHKIYIHKLCLSAILLTAIFIQSCVKDVENPPQSEPKLVVTSFITPNDSIKVRVTKSTPINYNTPTNGWDTNIYPHVTDAQVFIQNTSLNNETTIPYNTEEGMFILAPQDFSIEAGEEYMLRVSANGFETVTAITKLPNNAPDVLWYNIASSENEYETVWDITGSIQDFSDQTNYYFVNIAIKSAYFDSWADTTYISTYAFRDYFNDAGKDGEEIGFRTDGYSSSDDAEIIIHVQSTDYNYYQYHKMLDYLDYENPFSEPILLHSNVDGGLGIFASYLSTKIHETDAGD
ncbi:MAG: DUF4249 domain-containing protein [Bacteroidales bacterium]